MKKFFIALSLFFVMTGSMQAQENPAVTDPDAPAPASPFYIPIPHSDRTKGNLFDAALDFLFSRFFKSFKDPTTYEFFEVDKNNNLIFTNLKMNLNRANAKGVISVGKAMFNLNEFVEGIKSKKLMLSQTTLEKISIDIKVKKTFSSSPEQTEDNNRVVKASAETVKLDTARLLAWGEKKTEDISIKSVSGQQLKIDLSNPDEKYAAKTVTMQNIVVSADDPIHKTTFERAVVDGKSYQDSDAFLKAIRKTK